LWKSTAGAEAKPLEFMTEKPDNRNSLEVFSIMKFQKIFLCVAVALTAFGVSCGLFEILRYLTADSAPKAEPVSAVVEKTVSADTMPPEVTVFPPPPAAPTVSETEKKDEDETDYADYPDGEYYIIGELPKGFKDFDSLIVQTTDYSLASAENNYKEVQIAPKGYVYAKQKFDFRRIAVSRKRLSFETVTIKGVSYKFVGKFVEETIDMGEYMEHVELEGDLIKMRDGKKIAGFKVKLARGGC